MVLLPLIALLIWVVVGRELRPLTALARSVSTRTPDALDAFAEQGVPEEALPLVRSLNELLLRLRTALQSQRDFVADAAHELRTPLTALQLQVELLQRATNPVPASRRQRPYPLARCCSRWRPTSCRLPRRARSTWA